jgi:adenine phosphoribosyltransferase
MEQSKTYTLKLAGLERKLTILEVAPGISLASFVMLGDTRMIEAVANAIYARPDFPKGSIEYLVCPEAKAIPLTHALAVKLGVDYVVLRKTIKSYMRDPIVETTKSITTAGEQHLVLNGPDKEKLRGKRVCIVDDVVATGGSLRSIEKLLAQVDCTVVAKATALLEDAGYDGRDLIYLEKHPVFRDGAPGEKQPPGC